MAKMAAAVERLGIAIKCPGSREEIPNDDLDIAIFPMICHSFAR